MCMNNLTKLQNSSEFLKLVHMNNKVIHNFQASKKLIFFHFTCDIHTFHPYIIISNF